ncbi:hypothetical protein C8R46DRAFT_1099157 [Mycena filopes]|nr:hypothetical protein C8R46DRAFT_1099157 [Mycena filopes]
MEELKWLNTLSMLPALTHVAFSSQPHPVIVETVLQRCPEIHVLVIAFSASEKDAAREYAASLDQVMDKTLVVSTYVDYYADWEAGSKGGEDIWVHAERFVAATRCGELAESEYFLEHQ